LGELELVDFELVDFEPGLELLVLDELDVESELFAKQEHLI